MSGEHGVCATLLCGVCDAFVLDIDSYLPFLRYYYKVFFGKNQAIFIKYSEIVKSISCVDLVCWMVLEISLPGYFSVRQIPSPGYIESARKLRRNPL